MAAHLINEVGVVWDPVVRLKASVGEPMLWRDVNGKVPGRAAP